MSGQRKFGGAWETRRLGALATFRKGKGIRRTDLRKIGARCVRYGELYTRYRNYVVDPISRIPEDVAAGALRIEKGELLFAGSGETAKEIGTCVAYIGDEPAYAGGDIIVLRAPRQDPVYLAHLMNAPEAVRQKARMAQGDAVVHIRGDHLAEVELPLPPLPEQRAIAAVLMDVDALIGSLEALTAKKRAIKRAAMQQLLTGRTRLPGFEGEWGMMRAGDIGRFGSGSGFPLRYQGQPQGQYPFFKVSDMNRDGNDVFLTKSGNYVTENSRQSLGAVAFPPKAIVFAKVGAAVFLDRKRILVQPSCLDNNMAAYVPDAERVDHLFVYYLLSSIRLSAFASTTALPSLSRTSLTGIPLPLPPVPEQRAIGTVLSDMDAEITALERRLDKTRALKRGMMQQLLTGTIRLPIPDAVTEDEPGR